MIKKVRHIYLAFAVSFVVTIVISILYLEEFYQLQTSNEQLETSYQIKNKILKIQAYLVEAENTQRGYLITEDKGSLNHLSEVQKNIYAEIESLKRLVAEDRRQQNIIEKLKETISLRYQILYQTIDAEHGSNLLFFLKNAEKGKQIMQEFKALSNEMDRIETSLLYERKNKNTWLQFITSFYLKVLLIISILFQVASFLIITNAYKRKKVYQKVLENKIKELNLSNSEMEQIAFVASHDLQEPLRKIRTYSDKLKKKYGSELKKEGAETIDKIGTASSRMQELLNDFINYTLIVKSTEEAQTVQLKNVINDVRNEFKAVIETKKATFFIDDLPPIIGYNYQLHLLFSNLLDNALKFARPTVPPVISIKVSEFSEKKEAEEKEYIKISLSDNGIGFQKEFAEKIFIIFQRLHSQSSAYTGKGIGLAICKRIMVNHEGFITATGVAGVGATINLFFPKPE
ncbi:MAG TPA: CHASE3 domain-containing protein [Segetibacter sp.]|nr:CHASE3 domain-containing protein [Segetibacter sp.]